MKTTLLETIQCLLHNLTLNHNKKNSQNELTLYHNFYDRQYHEQGTNDYYESNATGIKYNFTKFF